MNRTRFFLRKIPRTRIYLRPWSLFNSLLELIFKPLKNGEWIEKFEREFSAKYNCKFAMAFPFARVAFFSMSTLKTLSTYNGGMIISKCIKIKLNRKLVF